VDVGCFTGSLGLFFTLFALFIRWVPQIAMFEVKAILPGAQPSHYPAAPGALEPAAAALKVREA
jgi:hypothetical protein